MSVMNSASTTLRKLYRFQQPVFWINLEASLDLQIRPQDWVDFHVPCGYPPDEKHNSRILMIFQPSQVSKTEKMELCSPSRFKFVGLL